MQLSRLSKLIFISLLFCWSNAQAGWWDKFVNLLISAVTPVTTPTYHFGDPNKPGINGGGTYTPNYMKINPPYDRQVGRGPLGTEANCLYNFRLAGDYEAYTRICAEDPGNNSATKHKIKLRNVSCFAGCWYQHFELDALKSECNFFAAQPLGAAQYILPIVARRICARIASPPGDGYSADPGYMQGTDSAGRARGKHLDTYGVTQWDDLVTDENGTEYPIFRPKICAYDDPWVLDIWIAPQKLISGGVTAIKNLIEGNGNLSDFLQVPIDIFDLNPISQPFHSASGVSSPVANLLIALLQLYISYQTAGPQMLEAIIMMVMSAIHVPGMDTAGEVMGIIFQVINFMLTSQASAVLLLLQANNQVNKYAYSNYGCVNLPLGDYPPNYCPTSASIVSGLLDSICSTDSSGNLYQNCYGSTTIQTDQTSPYNLCSPIKCVQSNYDNNFLNNTVRIGYTHPVQVCSTTLTKNCVNISGSLTRTSAMTNSNFVLGSGLSLVNVGNVTINSTKQYRVLYQVLNAAQTNIIEVSNYSYVDLPDCGGATNGYSSPTGGSVIQSTQFCQSIWGVDLGEYSDSFNISVSPTTTAPAGPLSTSSSPVSLSYVDIYSGTSSNNKFYVQINQQTEDYSHICAYQTYPGTSYGDNQIGCISRSSMPTPTISSCGTATHVSPCATLNWTARGKTGTNYTANATMTVPQFTSDWSSLPADPILYLGGASFSARVVDSSNLTIPYQPTDSNDIRIVSYNGTVLYNSIWGNYLSSIMPSSTCNQDTCSIYLNGLEYIGGHYVRGGSYLCIDNSKGCQNDTTQCVLAKNYTAFDGISTSTSISPSDRINPNTTSASLTSSQYYTYDNDVTLPSNQNIRSKIGLENSSMCVTVPPATCSVSTDGSTYNATWPSGSSAGQLITGTCNYGYTPIKPSYMSRYCFLRSTGATEWDTDSTRLASTFKGCALSCISNIQATSTQNVGAAGGSIAVTNTATGDTGGLLGIGHTNGVWPGGDPSSSSFSATANTTNTITITFDVLNNPNQADIYFHPDIFFNDYLRIVVNGVQITNDSDQVKTNSSETKYSLWGTVDLPSRRYYSYLDTNISNLNEALLNNLKAGSNTITITVLTYGVGGFWMGLYYNQICYSQCSNDNSGYATWTKAAVGGISVGTCNAGYAAKDSSKMTRYCSLSGSSGAFDTVSTGTSTISGTSSNSAAGTSFSGCVYGSCSGVSTASSSSGNAIWTLASYGSYSDGTCGTNYITNNTTKMKRLCTIVGNDVTLETIQSNGTTSSGNFAGCTLGSCSAVTTSSSSTGNATWEQANAGSLSRGSCTSGYAAIDSTKMTRACTVSNNVASLDTISNGISSNSTYGASFLGCTATSCPAVTAASSSTGNATWSGPTAFGSKSTGQCSGNYVAVNSSNMTRACVTVNGSTSLDTISNGTSSNSTYSASFSGCNLGSCSNDNAGYATWTAVNAGETSVGTCNSGYTAAGSMTRYCQTNSGNTATYLDTVSSNSFYYGGTSSNSPKGTSFQGCVYNRIDNFSYLATNYSWTGCRTDVKTSWSGLMYYVSMNTCYSTSGNGVYGNPYALNEYRITFYLPTESAKYNMGFTHLKFNDYVYVQVDQSGAQSNFVQVTTDSTNVSGYSLYSSTTSTSGDLPSWRDYANASGGISSLTDAVRAKLVPGQFNTVRVFLKTMLGGGIEWGLWFYNPSSSFSWNGTYTTTATVSTGS